jgi:hypothetical protein
VDQLEPCNRCLAIVDARTTVWDQDTNETAPNPTGPATLRLWAIERQGHRLAINDMPQAFAPVSTWHGDPVCAYHLLERVQAERRGR